jgi:hypothetical protein
MTGTAYETFVDYQATDTDTGVWHRSPMCARGATVREDSALEVYGRALDLDDVTMDRVGNLTLDREDRLVTPQVSGGRSTDEGARTSRRGGRPRRTAVSDPETAPTPCGLSS